MSDRLNRNDVIAEVERVTVSTFGLCAVPCKDESIPGILKEYSDDVDFIEKLFEIFKFFEDEYSIKVNLAPDESASYLHMYYGTLEDITDEILEVMFEYDVLERGVEVTDAFYQIPNTHSGSYYGDTEYSDYYEEYYDDGPVDHSPVKQEEKLKAKPLTTTNLHFRSPRRRAVVTENQEKETVKT